MKFILLIFLAFIPCVVYGAVQVASTDYVQHIVNSIPKVDEITESITEQDLPTALAVREMGALIRAEILQHVENNNNPHAVTAGQVGLGNVKNIDTTDAANIITGVIAYERLPIGMTANTVAAGNDSRFFGVPRTKPSTVAPDGMVWMWFE